MTAINHALTGATIGLLVGNPWVAIPAAFLSHFVLDALPHYGSSTPNEDFLRTRFFAVMLMIDAALCFLLVLGLFAVRPDHWLLASICAFMAASPDMMWINQLLKVRAHKPWKPSLISRFAVAIQWFAKPIGTYVEFVWFAGAIVVLGASIGLMK